MKDLIGKPAFQLIDHLAEKISFFHGTQVAEFTFVWFSVKDHEQKGQIRVLKVPGDESFLHLSPDSVSEGELERQLDIAQDCGDILGLSSTVFLMPASVYDTLKPTAHLFLLDIVRSPTKRNITELRRQLCQRLGLESGAIVASSERGMHFYSDRLFSLSDWLALYGESLLMNHTEYNERWVDERHIGHTIKPFPYWPSKYCLDCQPLENVLSSTLRLSATKQKPQPYVIDVF